MTPIRRTILLVEDNPSDVLLFQAAASRLEAAHQLTIMPNGEAAVAYLDGQQPYNDRLVHPVPGLVFLDLNLPAKSGFEVLTWIRNQPRFRKLQVVVLTGSRHTIDIYRAYELGASAYLVKPVAPRALTELGGTLKLQWLARLKPGKPPPLKPAQETRFVFETP